MKGFKKIKNGYKDLKTGLVWDIDFKTNVDHQEALDYAALKGKRLPTKEEFEEAENNGIRQVRGMDWKYWFWSSTLLPSSSDVAFGFDGYYGVIGSGVRDVSYDVFAVRCVSAPSAKKIDSKFNLKIDQIIKSLEKLKV